MRDLALPQTSTATKPMVLMVVKVMYNDENNDGDHTIHHVGADNICILT